MERMGAPASFGERVAERRALVQALRQHGVRDERVLGALERVPRHAFVPDDRQSDAYRDGPLPIGYGQTISQPYVVALMTEALELTPHDRVLEIGTGSGYQTAVLAELCSRVFTIELEPDLAQDAQATLAVLGYDNVDFRVGDGAAGWPDAAPFDACIAAAAPARVPDALIAQLAPGGRLCLPVGATPEDQMLIVLRKTARGEIERRTLGPVRFVPLRGP
jgi:protein-L-isoaspartate(D-aspartate) O-methyltransferase